MTEWIAVDGGQSATRVRASWRADVAEGGGFVHGAERVAAIASAVAMVLDRLQPLPEVDTIAVGHTGLPADPAEHRLLARALAARTHASRVVLAPDWVTAHRGALGGDPGVVLSVGTGAVALGITETGEAHRVDGDGYLFGDAGSGFWIGRAGVDAALRSLDSRAADTALVDAARARFGADLRAATWRLYASPSMVDDVARFAPDVVALADTDPAAARIVDEAAGELVRSAAAAARPFGATRPAVAVTGRLIAPDGALWRRFVEALDRALPGASPTPPLGGSLEGAVAFAQEPAGIHSSLLSVFTEPR